MLHTERNEIPAGIGARQADGGSGGGRAVLGELHHFRAGHHLKQILGALYLRRRRPREVATKLHLPAGGRNYARKSVAERHRAQPHSVLGEFVAINVPDMATKASGDESGREHRILIITFRISMRAAGYARARNASDPANLSRSGFLIRLRPTDSSARIRSRPCERIIVYIIFGRSIFRLTTLRKLRYLKSEGQLKQ
jgi:hypothetical protein